MEVRDSEGALLNEGDSVTLIKDINVRGSAIVIKSGTVVENVRFTAYDTEIEGLVQNAPLVFRTEFLKKV